MATCDHTPPPAAPARRSFLALFGGAIAAPAAIALPAIAAATAPTLAESPELLALAERLPPIRARLAAAMARKAEALAIYERMKPARSDELQVKHGDGALRDMAAIERGPDNNPIPGPGGYGVVHVYRWRGVQAHIIAEDVSRHTKAGKRLRRIVRLAKAYEAGMAAALRESKIREAISELVSVSVEAYRVVDVLRTLKPTTMAGAMIYVSTAALLAETRRQTGDKHADNIEDLAVAAVIRLGGGAQ